MLTRAPHRFTVDDYDRMIDHGILNKNHRVELIHGLVLEKEPYSSPHSACTRRLNHVLHRPCSDRALLSPHCPLRLIDSVPEPDFALLALRADFYASGHPQAPDVLLAVEVADTTLDYDRTVKGPLYAAAGIQEYWIVNINDHCIETHCGPRPDGAYQDIVTVRPGQTLTIAALPGCTLRAEEILS